MKEEKVLDGISFAIGYNQGKNSAPVIETQEKEITVTENGTTEVTPDEGKLLAKVTVNTEVAGSGADVVNSIIDKSITEIESDATSIGNYMFIDCKALTSVVVPNATSIGYYVFYGCIALQNVVIPNATRIGYDTFNGCVSLKSVVIPNANEINSRLFYYCTELINVDFPKAKKINSLAFNYCHSLTAVILRSVTMCTLNASNIFKGCYHIDGTQDSKYNPGGVKDGYIYVPSALVESYKIETNWSALASQFRALEDYTVDGSITGELDPNKI